MGHPRSFLGTSEILSINEDSVYIPYVCIERIDMLKYPLKIKRVGSVNQLHLFLLTYKVSHLIFSDLKTVQFKN